MVNEKQGIKEHLESAIRNINGAMPPYSSFAADGRPTREEARERIISAIGHLTRALAEIGRQ